MDVFERLGSSIESAWARAKFCKCTFNEIAANILAEHRLHEIVNSNDIFDIALHDSSRVEQCDPMGLVSNGSLTLFATDQFFIEALFWLDKSTNIHDHGFHGAFTVLEGSSLHSSYSFEPAVSLDESVKLGELRRVQTEVLREGEVRSLAGSETIHSLIHIDRPTVSLLVRTRLDRGFRNYTYYHPGLAYEPRLAPTAAQKTCQFLRILYESKEDLFWSYLLDKSRSLTDADNCHIVMGCSNFVDWDDLDQVVQTIISQNRPLQELLSSAMSDAIRHTRLSDCRHFVLNHDSRLLLALLTVQAEKPLILELLATPSPARGPLESLTNAINALGTAPGHEQIGALLGYPIASGNLRILTEMIAGRTEFEIAKELGPEDGQASLLDEVAAIAKLCRSSLFASLL